MIYIMSTERKLAVEVCLSFFLLPGHMEDHMLSPFAGRHTVRLVLFNVSGRDVYVISGL